MAGRIDADAAELVTSMMKALFGLARSRFD